MKKITAKIAATVIAFICASIFRCLIKYQPIATAIALNIINVVLMVGNIGNDVFIFNPFLQ
jgi:uncharacterized membrane protein YgaE (UPF0421/DUF939 family)